MFTPIFWWMSNFFFKKWNKILIRIERNSSLCFLMNIDVSSYEFRQIFTLYLTWIFKWNSLEFFQSEMNNFFSQIHFFVILLYRRWCLLNFFFPSFDQDHDEFWCWPTIRLIIIPWACDMINGSLIQSRKLQETCRKNLSRVIKFVVYE